MTDPVELLTPIWETWDTNPGSRTAAAAKEAALTTLGLPGNHTHELIANHRRHTITGHPEGPTIGDAIQHATNELKPIPKEAS